MFCRCLITIFLVLSATNENSFAISRKAALGKELFFDTNLSTPPGQACASCHDPKVFFTDPDNKEPTSEGIIEGRFGPRNAPTLMYNLPTPPFHFDKAEGLFKGGQFVDGRARTTVDQAKGPSLSPIEMNNQNALEVVEKVRSASYANLFRRVYGNAALDNPAKAYNRIAEAIAAFERTPVFTPMTSKYDYYLQGKANFTAQERRGRLVFEAEDKGNCAACHPSRPDNNGAQRPLFTDFTYDNLGVPKNPANPFYQQAVEFNPLGYGYVDRGLGDHVQLPSENGKFKVPTLRNIAKTAPYMHNGYFKTLRGVVDFYNTRDVKPRCKSEWTTEQEALRQGCWPAAEVASNVNHDELGKLGLSEQDVIDLLAFLETLTDGYQPGRE
jgi:cytochrome c peroxidase